MKIQVELDKEDVKKFRDGVDKLFNDIRSNTSFPNNYEYQLTKVRKGMHENKLALKNSAGWEKVKAKLRADGKIPYSDPLNVTGQLVDDFYARSLSTNKANFEQIGVELTFKDVMRLRPTLNSMYAHALSDGKAPIVYEMSSSYMIALRLEKYTGTINGVNYNITDAIYGLYKDDFANRAESLINKAFRDNK